MKMFWRSWVIRNTYHFKTELDNNTMKSNPPLQNNKLNTNNNNTKKKLNTNNNMTEQRKREEEMIDIVMEMSGGSYVLSKIALEENNMDIFKAINQIKL